METTKVIHKSVTNLSDLQKEIVESVKAGKSLLGVNGALNPDENGRSVNENLSWIHKIFPYWHAALSQPPSLALRSSRFSCCSVFNR